ncbi:MAG: bifunctional transaldolase/phosoglucose isomerase [Deltaproteobacteria bacterium]
MSRIRDLQERRQSVWLDDLERRMIWTGGLYRLVADHGVRGVTTNPSIFEKAIGSSDDYDPAIYHVVRTGVGPMEVYESLAIDDVQSACDVLRPTYRDTDRVDGYVSLEVSPHLAYDTERTVEQAERLWEDVGRDNLMIKVPGTEEGLTAFEHLIGEGVNVNVTLLFSCDRYREVAEGYLAGLEHFVEHGGDPSRIASVASFFVSRIDSLIDAQIDARKAEDPSLASRLDALRGQVAIHNARAAYGIYTELLASDRWAALASAGARPQRLLWASTSTKDPAYRDTLYVEQLIGPDTVNTIPTKTFEAFLDHGEVADTLVQDGAEAALAELAACGIDLGAAAAQLEKEGVDKFAVAFDGLLSTVAQRREAALTGHLSAMDVSIGSFGSDVEARLDRLASSSFVRRLWARDGTLFGETSKDHGVAASYMGWLDIAHTMEANVEHLDDLIDDLRDDGVRRVVVMGMGGSSLAPDVFRATFGAQEDAPELMVLDSTVPAQVASMVSAIGDDDTVFIVASKSGTTTEPLAFDSFFWARESDGGQFIAVTDPGSKLERMAMERDFRGIYNGDPEVGGRYSALSPFGLVPAAAMGMDVQDLLDRARLMIGSCDASVPPHANPGVRLGVILGELALAGRDKLTLVCSSSIATFGAWVEQLIAESTGKHGKGIVPIDGESLGAPSVYGSDRVFAHLMVAGDDVASDAEKLAALEAAGHPVLRFVLPEPEDLVQEMFRWEIATATAGHVMGINPFDQPNVQESKTFTKEILEGRDVEKLESVGTFDGIALSTDAANAGVFEGASDLAAALKAHLDRAGDGDYVALNAYVEMNDANDARLQAIRHHLRDSKGVATTVGYGPRFLHSTGQLHKGGANNGVFLVITSDDATDLDVPGERYTFGALKRAQEAGDILALSKRERRLVRVHLGADVEAGLDALVKAIVD